MHDINVYMHEQVGWDIRSRVGGVRIMNVLRMAECSPVCSLGGGNPTELDLRYV